MELQSLKGDSLVVTFQNCSLHLSVTRGEVRARLKSIFLLFPAQTGTDRTDSPARFLLEEWILGDTLVIWAARSLQEQTGHFVGVSDNYIKNIREKIARSERCKHNDKTTY